MTNHHKDCQCNRCSLCNCVRYDTFMFKKGYVCEECLEFLRQGIHLPDSPDSL